MNEITRSNNENDSKSVAVSTVFMQWGSALKWY